MIETLKIGDAVRNGDYRIDGYVQGIITKRSGEIRYAVEDDRGGLFIFNERQLERRGETE